MRRAVRFTVELVLFVPLLVGLSIAWALLRAFPGLDEPYDEIKPPKE